MHRVGIIITEYVDDHFPGWVRCQLTDAEGRAWIFTEKVPVVSPEDLGPSSTYPRPAWIACRVLSRAMKDRGREVVEIDTAELWGIESADGVSRFRVSVWRSGAGRVAVQMTLGGRRVEDRYR